MQNFDINSLGAVFLGSLQQLVTQLFIWLPKLIMALIIWWVGRFLLDLAANWLKKVDIPGTEIDNKLIKKFNQVFLWAGKVILVLVILDYLGIGRTIVGAIANGLTLTIALALGIAFGQSLKPEADLWVKKAKGYLKK